MTYVSRVLKVTASGGAGVAVGSDSAGVGGVRRLVGVWVDYSPGAAATLDITLTDATGRTILALANTVTDGMYYPREPNHTSAGVANAAGDNKWEWPIVHGELNLAVAQANGNDIVTITAFFEG